MANDKGYAILWGEDGDSYVAKDGKPMDVHQVVDRLKHLERENEELRSQLQDANHLVKQYELLDLLPGGLM